MNPSATIRQIAKRASTPEMRDLLLDLAAAFENQHNRQNNQWGAALGNAELGIDNRLEQLEQELSRIRDIITADATASSAQQEEILERITTAEERDRTMLEMLEDLQNAIHARNGDAAERGDRDDAG